MPIKGGSCIMKRFIILLIALLLGGMLCTKTVLANDSEISVIVDEEIMFFDVQPTLEEGRVLIPLRAVSEAFHARVDWDNTEQLITIYSINHTIEVTVGKSMARVDGHPVVLDVSAKVVNGRTLVPLRFISEIMGMSVDWDNKTNTVKVKSKYIIDESERYIIDSDTGTLYSVSPDKEFLQIAEGIKLVTKNGDTKINVEQTANQNILITITNNYGEPRNNYNQYTIYIFRNEVRHRTEVRYFNRFSENVTHHENQVILTDGTTGYVFDDTTGEMIKQIDLQQLGGHEGSYFVEGFEENFILLRENGWGILTLVRLDRDNERIELYKELFDQSVQKSIENIDIPYRGDHLRYLGRRGEILLFNNQLPFIGEEDDSIYQYVME